MNLNLQSQLKAVTTAGCIELLHPIYCKSSNLIFDNNFKANLYDATYSNHSRYPPVRPCYHRTISHADARYLNPNPVIVVKGWLIKFAVNYII